MVVITSINSTTKQLNKGKPMQESTKRILDDTNTSYFYDFIHNRISFYDFCKDLETINKDDISDHKCCNQLCKFIIQTGILISSITGWKNYNLAVNSYHNIYSKSLINYIFGIIKKSLAHAEGFEFDVASTEKATIFYYFKTNDVDKYYVYYTNISKLKLVSKDEFDAVKNSMGKTIKFVNRAIP